MSDDGKQKKIIQEQLEANRRIIRGVERKQNGVVEGQVPINERVKQLKPNERIQPKKPSKPKS